MFFSVGQSVRSNAWETIKDRATLESFILHLRNLTDFLYPTTVRPDDIIAAYYFDDKCAWQRMRPTPPASLLDARSRAHKGLVHLTTGRETGDPHWKIKDLLTGMHPLIVKFANTASPHLLDPAVAREIPSARILADMPEFFTSTSSTTVVRISPPPPAPTFADECEEETK